MPISTKLNTRVVATYHYLPTWTRHFSLTTENCSSDVDRIIGTFDVLLSLVNLRTFHHFILLWAVACSSASWPYIVVYVWLTCHVTEPCFTATVALHYYWYWHHFINVLIAGIFRFFVVFFWIVTCNIFANESSSEIALHYQTILAIDRTQAMS